MRLFLDDGYEQTTVAKIREASGVSNGALFHRFSSKEAIAAALYVDAIKSFQDEHWRILDLEAPATLRDMVDAIVGHQLQWIQDNPDAAQFVYDRGQLDCFAREIVVTPTEETTTVNGALEKDKVASDKPAANTGAKHHNPAISGDLEGFDKKP